MATCEERINEEMERAIGNLRNPTDVARLCSKCSNEWYAEDGETICPDCGSEDTEIDSLSFVNDNFIELTRLYTVYRAGISWGGPADGFYLYVDPETGEIDKAEYYFQDWFDGAKRDVIGEDLDLLRMLLGDCVGRE